MSEKSGKSRLGPVFFINLLAILIFLAGAEIFLRWYVTGNTIFEEESHYQFDKRLGWAPKPGKYLRDYGVVTISARGLRECSLDISSRMGSKKILACGDSFTFGSFISDEETWPCFLASRLRLPVVNAGVSGFGLDQIVLRMEETIGPVNPELVIISFIIDDIHRCEMSKRDRHKPYYIFNGTRPVLHNDPVPPPGVSGENPSWHERSFLLDRLLKAFQEDNKNIVIVHNQGMKVARYLFEKAKNLTDLHGARLMVVIQPEFPELFAEGWKDAAVVAAYLKTLGIPVLNLYPIVKEAFPSKEKRENIFSARYHLDATGNRWVADKIADFIEQYRLL